MSRCPVLDTAAPHSQPTISWFIHIINQSVDQLPWAVAPENPVTHIFSSCSGRMYWAALEILPNPFPLSSVVLLSRVSCITPRSDVFTPFLPRYAFRADMFVVMHPTWKSPPSIFFYCSKYTASSRSRSFTGRTVTSRCSLRVRNHSLKRWSSFSLMAIVFFALFPRMNRLFISSSSLRVSMYLSLILTEEGPYAGVVDGSVSRYWQVYERDWSLGWFGICQTQMSRYIFLSYGHWKIILLWLLLILPIT